MKKQALLALMLALTLILTGCTLVQKDPKVDAAKCVGCGRCENYCPAERKAIHVRPLDPQVAVG